MRVLVVTPMEAEQALFNKALSTHQSTKHQYKVICTGVGKVASSSEVAVELLNQNPYDLVYVIGFGAGSSHFNQGDLVFPSTAVQHDINIPSSFQESLSHMYRVFNLEGNDDDTVILTGDSFITKELEESLTVRYPKKRIYDMEAGAIAQVCTEYGVPLLVSKLVSDIPSEENNDVTFDQYVDSCPDFNPFILYIELLDDTTCI